ncbi:translation initiation factor IF-2 [Elysia marginata]|uniref:Translation initiation factor IF-2 n=1 Tax=Elysia marginata TaxID=1093978 RepID=A0AAV4GPF4_9GAST|nr:translation initiation factor IF-2 [Elysia marginata]
MTDERGENLKKVGPSTPAAILGLDGSPQAGDKFYVFTDEKEAKRIAVKRQHLQREQRVRTQKHITLDEIGRRIAIGNFKEFNIILKGDVDGSVEALTESIQKLSNEEVHLNVIYKGVGAITESDILLASTCDAIVIGFNVKPVGKAKTLAEKEEIDVRTYSIIFDAINNIKDAIEGLLSPEVKEEGLGTAEILDDYTWIEALYMTVITISTVGFTEVHPTDDSTKLFITILIIFGILVFAFIASVFAEYWTHEKFYLKRSKRMIKKLKGHIIIFGYGKTGRETAKILSRYKKDLVVVETSDITSEERKKGIYFLTYDGDVSNERILLDAGIKEAQYLIATLPNDAENVFLVLSAKQLNPNVKIISRASHTGSESKLRFAGADQTVMVNRISGKHIAHLMLFPRLVNFLELLSDGSNDTPLLEEVTIRDVFSPTKTILDLNIRNKTGCNVIAYITPENKYIVNPGKNTFLSPNSKIIVIGTATQIEKVNALFSNGESKILGENS